MRFNSVPKVEYWTDPEWNRYLDLIGLDRSYYRRNWEWVQVAYGLDRLGKLNASSRGLGIGVGNEPLIFYLASRCREIVATDTYSRAWRRSSQADPAMLTTPEKFSPIPYPRERLHVRRMDGLRLEFPEEAFDFVWSVGAIEHFGNSAVKHGFRTVCRVAGFRKMAVVFDHQGAKKAVREMARVLRPAGIAAITTECVLNGVRHHEYFLPDELRRFVIEPSGMEPIEEDIDIDPSPLFRDHVLPKHLWHAGTRPHIILREQRGVEFTSVSLFLRKPCKRS